jgi:hypothetical protein
MVSNNFKLSTNSRLYVNSNWVFEYNVRIANNRYVFTKESRKLYKLLISYNNNNNNNNNNKVDYEIHRL